MKAQIGISMADDNGVIVTWNNLYKQELKSYTIPDGDNQFAVLKTIFEKAKAQVQSEIYTPGS